MSLLTRVAAAFALVAAATTPAFATWIWPGDVPPAIQRAFAAKSLLRNEIVYALCPHHDSGTAVLTAYRGFVTWEHINDPVRESDRLHGITRRERYDVQYKYARLYNDLEGAWGAWYEAAPEDQVIFTHDIVTRDGKTHVTESSCRRPSQIPR